MDQVRLAIMAAMEQSKAFSWLRGQYKGDAHLGVYIRHTQKFIRST